MIVSFLYPFNLRGVDAPYLWVYYHQLAKFLPDELLFIGDGSYLRDLEYFRDNKRWEISNEFVTQKRFLAQNDFSYLCLDKIELMDIYNKYEDDLAFFKEYLISDISALVDIINAAIKKILQTAKIDAVISWSNCPSLQRVCDKYSIPVVYNEVGPLRSPIFLYSSFFDFNGVNGNTSVDTRFEQFINVFESEKIELFSVKELKKIFVTQNYLELFNELDSPQYDFGLALQVENDSNVIAFANGFNNFKLIAEYDNPSLKRLIRKHPASTVDYSMFGELDSSANSIFFIKKCENIATVNSGTALEALLMGKNVILYGDSPYCIINSSKYQNIYSVDKFRLLVLNFLLIGYLVPFEYLYDKTYIRFRLANNNEADIFNFHKVIWMKVHECESYISNKYVLKAESKYPENSHMQLFYYQHDEINVPDVSTEYFAETTQSKFNFTLENISDLTHIRIDLTNFPVVANLEYVKLILADGVEHLLSRCYSNANLIEGNSYIYLHDDPINVYYLANLGLAVQKIVVEIAVDLQPIKRSEIFAVANQVTAKQNEKIQQLELIRQQELSDVRNQLQNTQGELQNTQGELQNTQGELQNTQGELQNTQGELQNTQGELQNTQGELQNTQGELQNTQSELHGVYHSKSWQITKPLRQLCNLFKI